tara:strand:+ start:270 stop:1001 length:732 start_codon:yes stop_codon:yes gene_type:complete
MKIGALMLARSGSSFIDKNIKEVYGYPLMSFGMMAAKQVKLIDHFYLSSDSDLYLQMGEKYGYSPIKRPTSLSKVDSKSDDAVLHAVKNLKFLRRCDIIIVQHANVITIYPKIISESISILSKNNNFSSVVPAHVNSEYNPHRAYFRKKNSNEIKPAIKYNSSISPNRQDLPEAIFIDHSFWCIKTENIFKNHNFSPWNSLGNRIHPLLTNGMFDIHNEEDIKKSKEWLKNNKSKISYLNEFK